jgi:hypothetical protein
LQTNHTNEGGLEKPSPNPFPNRNYGPIEFGIKQEFIEENKKINFNLVTHRQNNKHKFAPYTRTQRRKRRMVAELMNVDRNTINNDLKSLYNDALSDYNRNNMDLDDIVNKQLMRLETERDRLRLYLTEAKDINNKIAIESVIADIGFKLTGAIGKLDRNAGRFWDEIINELNKIAENKNFNMRFTSPFELREISKDSRKTLNKLMEEISWRSEGIVNRKKWK